jgi:ABC-type branched-subunit amino acid transport system substrate-binding protein
MQEYRDALAKYESGQTPGFYSAAGYAAAKAFTQVVKTIKGAVTSQSIAAAFASAGTIETGVLPPLSFSATKHRGTDQLQRMTVSGGKFVAVGDFYDPPPLSTP